jgi:hypothetical protein
MLDYCELQTETRKISAKPRLSPPEGTEPVRLGTACAGCTRMSSRLRRPAVAARFMARFTLFC